MASSAGLHFKHKTRLGQSTNPGDSVSLKKFEFCLQKNIAILCVSDFL